MNITRVLSIAFIAFGLTKSFHAKATDASSGAPSMAIPFTIARNFDMNFGSVLVSASIPGTVVLTPVGKRTTGGGIILPAAAGRVTPASFTLSGQGSYLYAVTLPVSCIITDAGHNSMKVTGFTSDHTTGIINQDGSQVLHIGATLNVPAGQPSGVYTNATGIPVTVNYN
jgi:hypothetical protein